MTRNTKFYKTKGADPIYYRDLTTNELTVLGNIKNPVVRQEMAATLTIINKDPETVPFEAKVQIGEDIIYRSNLIFQDPAILDVTINEFRKNITEGEAIVAWLTHITKYFPGTSVVDLLNLTPKDLIELVVLCEEISGDKIFGSKQKKMNFVNPENLSDNNKKALRDQIRNLNTQMGLPR
jgi:hypothetical protein